MSSQRNYRGQLYQAYASRHAGRDSNEAVSRNVVQDLLPHLTDASSHEVLDLGCGQGSTVLELQERGLSCVGIDISPEQIEIAKGKGADVFLIDFRNYLPAHMGNFSAIIAIDFFEHLAKEEVVEALEMIVGALRPGGVLICRVPNAASPLVGRISHGDFTHETCFTEASIRQVCIAAGFLTVRVLEMKPKVHGIASACRSILWRIYSNFLKLVYAVETGVLRGHIVSMNLTCVAKR